ncbi:replication region DNA-binding N-term [Paraburkholderia diazotrophica]|uniref:Replication region DNA-binding N-term n=1 Tax=Paraburkholderia diazotrophica TaxID=667676 RepID=A0A1H7E6C3_9BURK|nr:replication region DNA-binding N-term [Paraburkholderia diazotrophica]
MSDAPADLPSDDARLAAEIDRLKAAFPKTRELYREVCVLLFFRFGQAPTANRLYQLVKRGSMGTPAAVLGEFRAEQRVAAARGELERTETALEQAHRGAARRAGRGPRTGEGAGGRVRGTPGDGSRSRAPQKRGGDTRP